jgi:hypothetical protein
VSGAFSVAQLTISTPTLKFLWGVTKADSDSTVAIPVGIYYQTTSATFPGALNSLRVSFTV